MTVKGRPWRELDVNEKSESIFAAVVELKRRLNGNSPTIREIAERVGAPSTSVVDYHLCRLEDQGRLTRAVDGRARMIFVYGSRWCYEGVSVETET